MMRKRGQAAFRRPLSWDLAQAQLKSCLSPFSALVVLTAGCSPNPPTPNPDGGTDAGTMDAGTMDAGTIGDCTAQTVNMECDAGAGNPPGQCFLEPIADGGMAPFCELAV
jgi:hypothetical protein